MPRYFFNVRNHIVAEDFDGRELADLKTATREAQMDIADIIRVRFETLGNWSRWSIEICDEDRVLLKVVPFSTN